MSQKDINRRQNIKIAEAAGKIDDSREVRSALMARVHAGEITLDQAQDELERIIRSAKAAGKITRHQVFFRD